MIINYIHWNPDPEIINIFGISIRYYGLLFVSGLILCIYILRWIYKRDNIPSENLEKLSIYGMIGMPTTKPWGIIFKRVDNIPRHPAQLYEAISYFLIFAIMIFLYKTQREKLKNGFFFGLVLVLIFTARFIIEFVKENQVGFEDGMTLNMGQLLSLPYIFVGIGFIIFGIRKTIKLSAQYAV